MLKDRDDRNFHGASLAELFLTETNDVYGFETGVQPATITRIKIFWGAQRTAQKPNLLTAQLSRLVEKLEYIHQDCSMPEIEPPVHDCISDSYILISLAAAVLFLYFSSRSKEMHLQLWNRFNCRYLDDRKYSWWFPLMLTNTRGHCLFLYFMKEKALCPSMGFPRMEQCCLGCWVGTSLTLKLCFLSVDCTTSQ